jgi:hypothetical protein
MRATAGYRLTQIKKKKTQLPAEYISYIKSLCGVLFFLRICALPSRALEKEFAPCQEQK